jgi:hypothetical protein
MLLASPRETSWALVSLFLLQLALLPACGRQSAAPPASGPASAPAAPAAAELPLPPKGEVVVKRTEHGYTVRANEALRVKIVRSMGEAGDFTVRVRGVERVDPVTYSVANASPEAIVAELFQGVGYAFFYEPAPAGGPNVLNRIALGSVMVPRQREKATAAKGGRARRGDRAGAQKGEHALTPEQQVRAAMRRAEHEKALAEISDADAGVRADAVAELDTSQLADVTKLRSLLADDPSPEVRKAAADQLSTASGADAAEALVQALGDSDPGVVLQSIDSLEFVGDASLVPSLTPLLSHPDPEVRKKAEEAIGFLGN